MPKQNSLSTSSVEWSGALRLHEDAPHLGGLWEAAVKSLKHHVGGSAGDFRLILKELGTILAQVEACTSELKAIDTLPQPEGGIEVLTPGHFLIGRLLEALSDLSEPSKPISLLRRWHLRQVVTRHLYGNVAHRN